MRQKKIVIYLIVSYGISWLAWLPLYMNYAWKEHVPILQDQFEIASFGPLAGAIIASLISGGTKELRDWFKRTYSLRFPVKWLAASVLMPVFYAVAAVIVWRVLNGAWPASGRFGLTSQMPGLTAVQTAVAWLLTSGLGEESGWRGFLLPELSRRFSLRTSALIVAFIWMSWHLPVFFFQERYRTMGIGIIGWIISLVFGSLILAWLCQKSRFSVLPVILWHGGFNLITAGDTSAGTIAMVCGILVAIQGILLSRKLGRSGNPA